MEHVQFMQEAVQLAVKNVLENNGGPFGAIVVKDGKIIGRGVNGVEGSHDPSAHAEMDAIREACQTLGTTQLTDCVIYASGEPCPMCMGVIYWVRPKAVYFGASKREAAEVGFGPDPMATFYQEMNQAPEARTIPIKQIKIDETLSPFTTWVEKKSKE